MTDGERRDGPGPTEADEWRHVREVLAKRTPDSELLIHRSGGEIVYALGGRPSKRLAFRVTEMADDVQCSRDLDALSILWNTADELLSALARERRRAAEMRRALEWYALGKQDGGLWATCALKDADAPGRGGEGGGR